MLMTGAGFGKEEAETVAWKAPCRTVVCYWCASLWPEEALRPFSGSSVSMMPHSAASEAED